MTKDPNFTVNNADRELLDLILDRAMAFAAGQQGPRIARIDLDMDLTFTHANIVPLDLARLAASHLRDLTHDVFGIYRHINRKTGQLCFSRMISTSRMTCSASVATWTATRACSLSAGRLAMLHASRLRSRLQRSRMN